MHIQEGTFLRNTDKSNLHEMFPLPSSTFLTQGNQLGVIIRFKTFYLKIYDHHTEDVYIVQGFRYHEQKHVFEEKVSWFRLREFASQFTKEDYLISRQEPCEDPNCIILEYQMTTKYK